VGKAAAEALLAKMRGKLVENETCLPTEMILRRSCGCSG
jgi:DNA-binding LacI/PurR family transcriptional regulator